MLKFILGKQKTPPRQDLSERRNRLRGSTLVYRSSSACDGGQSEGICIPRAPGRTFCPQRVKGLSAGGPLSLAPWDGHTLSDRRAVHL